jgi:5-(carboxyamino)imidazole ribonucleotide mutase
VAIGKAGAANAGLLAVRILAAGDPSLRERLHAYRERIAREALEAPESGSTAGPA